MAKKNKDIEIAVADVVDFMRVTGSFSPALREVVNRKVTVQAARDKKIRVTTSELQKTSDAFRLVNGLNTAKDTEKWLSANGVSLETFEDFLETNLLINKFKESISRKGNKKYLTSSGIRESVKEMAYQDWLSSALK
jgi:hypothetical protein